MKLLPVCLVVMIAIVGCTKPPTTITGPADTKVVAVDPWPILAATIRRQSDVGTIRQGLNQFAADASANAADVSIPNLPATALQSLVDRFRPSDTDRREIESKAFTSLDPNYIAECMYFRDVVRSLDVGGLPLDKQASIGFAWVCRNVYLQQWLLGQTQEGIVYAPPVPPSYVLRRGYGTGFERTYVFLALLQQMGFDAGFVGVTGREEAPETAIVDNKIAKGPFWAVGVLVGKDVLLFDPWRGEPLPGPGGKGIGTLAQVKANLDQLKPWIEDKSKPWDVKLEDVKTSTVYLSAPFSALSMRMKVLEEKCQGDIGVALDTDLDSVASRFAVSLGTPPSYWGPPVKTSTHCYTRVLASFLPAEEGGNDRATGSMQLYLRLTKIEPIPLAVYVPPAELTAKEATTRLQLYFGGWFVEKFVDPAPREKIQRGQFGEAIKILVERELQSTMARERIRVNAQSEPLIREWCQTANETYNTLSRARLSTNRLADLPLAEAKVEEFWKSRPAAIQAITDTSIASVGLAESAYLLAVCKHEQAERSQVRYQKASLAGAEKMQQRALTLAQDSWNVANDAWQRYDAHSAVFAKAMPERKAHIQQLKQRAATLAADPNSDK